MQILLIIAILWILFECISLYLHRRSTITLYGIEIRFLYSGFKLLLRLCIYAGMCSKIDEFYKQSGIFLSAYEDEGFWRLVIATLFLFEFIFEQDLLHWHTKTAENPVKKENKSLDAFISSKRILRIPWNLFYVIAMAIYSNAKFRNEKIWLYFILWGLIDIAIWFFNFDWQERLYFKALRRKVFESLNLGYAWNSFLYGIIMQDDTKKIPSTFGSAHVSNRPSDIVIFDNDTELIPYFHNEIVTDKSLWFYLHSAIYIYAFDTSLYSANELDNKIHEAVSYLHYAIFRPTYIYLIGNKDELDWVYDKYDWMPDIKINIISDGSYITPRIDIEDYRNRMRPEFTDTELSAYEKLCKKRNWIFSPAPYVGNHELLDYKDSRHMRYYLQPDSFLDSMLTNLFIFLFHTPKIFPATDYRSLCAKHLDKSYAEIKSDNPAIFFRNYNKCVSHIYQSIPRLDNMFYFLPENEMMCCFFQNMFNPNERKTAILAGFDYADMCMRFILYYTLTKHSIPFSPELIKSDLQALGDAIIQYSHTDDFLYHSITTPMDIINKPVKFALDILSDLYYFDFVGNSITFAGLTNLLRHIRNETRGHGSIRDDIAEPLWHAMYVLLILLSDFLKIYNFKLFVKNDMVFCSYPDDSYLYNLKDYCLVNNGIACPMYQCHKKNNEYINYIRGKVFIPELIDK